MSRKYFEQIPNFEYVSRVSGEQNISDYIEVKNLFKRIKIREDIFSDLNYFTKYKIIGDERPDNVAYKIYGDSDLDWLVLISNNILNIQDEWPLTQRSFDAVMLEKYGSYDNLYSGIHHYETTELKNSLGNTLIKEGLRISPSWKTNGNFIEIINSQISVISSGDSVNPSKTVTVFMVIGIPGLEVGDQVTIEGVSENEYNGQHTITEILASTGSNVTGFKYELPSAPVIASPTMSNPRKEAVHFTVPEQSLNPGNSYYYEYWDAGQGAVQQVPSTSFVKSVTNYEYEADLEDAKRNIYVFKPFYLPVVFDELQTIMNYKKGGTQYVSPTLKRADNIRIYE